MILKMYTEDLDSFLKSAKFLGEKESHSLERIFLVILLRAVLQWLPLRWAIQNWHQGRLKLLKKFQTGYTTIINNH